MTHRFWPSAALAATLALTGSLAHAFDLGSAVLSASTALELLDPAQAARVRLSRGPVVEGAIVAAIQASIGDDLLTVCDAADATLTQDKLAE